MRTFGCAVMVRVPMCLSRVLFEVVSTRGTYGMLVPMNSYILWLFVLFSCFFVAVVVFTSLLTGQYEEIIRC